MEQSLQKFNANQHLIEWSQRISDCRNSGMSGKEFRRLMKEQYDEVMDDVY